jgi:hypothetical protein
MFFKHVKKIGTIASLVKRLKWDYNARRWFIGIRITQFEKAKGCDTICFSMTFASKNTHQQYFLRLC